MPRGSGGGSGGPQKGYLGAVGRDKGEFLIFLIFFGFFLSLGRLSTALGTVGRRVGLIFWLD